MMFILAAVTIAALALATRSAAVGGAGGPPIPPRNCGPGSIPRAGLLRAGGCLLQSNEAGFMLSPHVLHVGQKLTATVIPGSTADRWNWANFEAAVGAGAHNTSCRNPTLVGSGSGQHLAGTSCTVTVGPVLAGPTWHVYSMAISVPVVGAGNETGVSNDYFLVDNGLYEVGGLVTGPVLRHGQPEPVAKVGVQLTGGGLDETERTSALGRYAFAVPPGRYRVTVAGPKATRALPTSIPVSVHHNVTGADFVVFARDHLTIAVTPVGTTGATGNAAIAGGASAITLKTTLTNVRGVAKATTVDTTPPQPPPKALFCGPTGLFYPQLDSGGNPNAYGPFAQLTSSNGTAAVTIYAGNESGAYRIAEAETIRKGPGTGSASLNFTLAPRTTPLDGVSQAFYNLVAATGGAVHPPGTGPIFGLAGPTAAASPAQVAAARSAEQETLLAFLEANFAQIGADFGPVHTTGSGGAPGLAGIEFYDASSQVVMDTQTAEDIIGAAAAGQPLPSQDQTLPSLADYEAANGPVSQGHLTPDPSDPLTYFGWPYPPVSSDGTADERFFGNCVKPDVLQLRVEVDAPVNLLFTDPNGDQFGFTASGLGVTGASGVEFPAPTGAGRTFILPAETYSVDLNGTASATAHLTVFSPGSNTETTQVFTFPTKRRNSGALTIGPTGAVGPLRFGGHNFTAALTSAVQPPASPPAKTLR